MIDAIVRSSVMLAAGFALVGIFASRSAAFRHWILAAAVFGAAAVVPLSLAAPAWTITVPSFARRAEPITPRPETSFSRDIVARAEGDAAGAARAPLPDLPLLWAAGCAVMLAILGIGVARIRRIASRATAIADERWLSPARAIAARYGIRRAVALTEVDARFAPATWGARRPCVLLPPRARDWGDDRIHAVLSHELAHVSRADWLVQLLVQGCVAALWFNPLAWIAAHELRREAEQACDDAVLAQGITPADYAAHLIALARDCRRPAWAWMPALLMARPSTFERRIAAMLNTRVDRSQVTRRVATVLAIIAVVATLAAGTVRAVQAPPAELSGTVYDPSGGVIPGLTLTLSSPGQRTVSTAGGTVAVNGAPETNVQATTDSAGRFSFPRVAPGRFVLSASLPGFHQLREEFDLKAAPDWDRVVTLQVGALRETISVSATRAFAAPAPAGPAPIRVGGNIKVPMKVADVRPMYPESMRSEGRQADVQLEATIGRDGSVTAVHVVSAQIHPDFAIAAIDAVRRWRFTPTLLNGKPIDVVMTVNVQFSLSD